MPQLRLQKHCPPKGLALRPSAKEKVGVLPGALSNDQTLQHGNYNAEDDNAALLLMAFSRCFHLLHASPQMENVGRAPRSHRSPTAAHHKWATCDGCQVSTLPSEVTTLSSKCRLLPHKKNEIVQYYNLHSPMSEKCQLSINCFLSLAITEKTVEKKTCYRTNKRDSKNGLDFCH